MQLFSLHMRMNGPSKSSPGTRLPFAVFLLSNTFLIERADRLWDVVSLAGLPPSLLRHQD
jgi:hypothetical protein